jgi:predicted dehydrogenase
MTTARPPRVGCVGLGWIGLDRLRALKESGLVELSALCDSNPEALARAKDVVPQARTFEHYSALLGEPLDGVVIATPSGLHAAQCIAALERGLAVFCQKPLTRTAQETRRVLARAVEADRLLAVDFSYRHTRALGCLRDLVRSGELGRVFAAELVFHNAYGPDKSWVNDLELAGGGCLIDLGVHLLDAAIWVLGQSPLPGASASLFNAGRLLGRGAPELEDFALAQLALSGGASVSLACSFRSSFGAGARIEMSFFGTQGGAAFSNVDGSFYDFVCDRFRGTARERLVSPPDAWSGRGIVAWAQALCESPRYRAMAGLEEVATAIDMLYGRAEEKREVPSPHAGGLRLDTR